MLDCDFEVQRREFRVCVRLAVGPGERLALFGPSGAGKSTVLDAVAGLVPLARGSVRLQGCTLSAAGRAPVPLHRRGVGLLRQNPLLFPHLTVRANLAFACRHPADRAQLGHVVQALGLGPLLDARPAALSGGQRQRVAFARTLLSRFRVLLLDEPYTGLDAALRTTLQALVAEAVRQRVVPAVLVTHDLPEAQAFAEQLAVMDRGKVLQLGPSAELVARPASRRVAELLGYRSFVETRAEGHAGPGVWGVHPDRVVAGAAPDCGPVVTGTVRQVLPSGGRWAVELAWEAGQGLWVHLGTPVPPGAPLTVTLWDPPCFGPDGTLLAPSARPAPGRVAGG